MGFGSYLRRLRKSKRLTVRQLQELSGVSAAHITNVENGKRGIPSPELLNKLSGPLGVNHAELMIKAGYLTPPRDGELSSRVYEYPSITQISLLVCDAHQNAINKGWYEEPRTFGEVIALMHSELSEALEDHRNGREIKEIYYEGDKPCGIPTELADVVIRVFDACGYYGIDLEAAIREKMAFNATRPVRHGGKKL